MRKRPRPKCANRERGRAQHRRAFDRLRVRAHVAERVRPRGDEQFVLLVGAAVLQTAFAFEETVGGGVRHQHELNREAAHAVFEPEERRFRSEVEPPVRNDLARPADGRRRERHRADERLAEVFVVVIAGERENGAAAFEEAVEDFLPVADGFKRPSGARVR